MEILTSGQQKLLRAFAETPFFRSNFIMTGETALAACYLEHRLSEDLDPFTDNEAAATRMKAELQGLIASHDFSVEIARSFATFLEARVQCGGERVALHLALDAPCRLEPPTEDRTVGLRVESALDLSANKLAALCGRASAKDFVDLYFIHHVLLTIEELIPKAAQKNPGVEPYWLARAFSLVRYVETLPQMIKTLSLDQLKEFVLAQAEDLMGGADRSQT